MIDTASVRKLHAQCGCITVDSAPSPLARTDLEYDGCRLRVGGLRLAIECDECKAFAKDQQRPDLLVLRVVDDDAQWVVIEVKRTIQAKARRQIEAGLEILARSPLFDVAEGCLPLAIIAYSRRRATDLDQYRLPLRVRGRVVPVRVVQCGDDEAI